MILDLVHYGSAPVNDSFLNYLNKWFEVNVVYVLKPQVYKTARPSLILTDNEIITPALVAALPKLACHPRLLAFDFAIRETPELTASTKLRFAPRFLKQSVVITPTGYPVVTKEYTERILDGWVVGNADTEYCRRFDRVVKEQA